ncbi:MAG: hypothetical protein J1F35_07560 [Erysipelotrichales bacterium]|nr:hypothetical protein [Erysipelotrichales bacterium]
MLNIVIGDKRYTYLNSAKIDDNCYIAYSDGETTYISGFHFEGDTIIIEEIDDETFLEVKEVLS